MPLRGLRWGVLLSSCAHLCNKVSKVKKLDNDEATDLHEFSMSKCILGLCLANSFKAEVRSRKNCGRGWFKCCDDHPGSWLRSGIRLCERDRQIRQVENRPLTAQDENNRPSVWKSSRLWQLNMAPSSLWLL